jgi:transcriptional regulator with XRE-family HTH domain
MGNKNRKPSQEIRWRLATNLKRLREARGYTQLELARRTGLTNAYISKIEQELMNVSLANLGMLRRRFDQASFEPRRLKRAVGSHFSPLASAAS